MLTAILIKFVDLVLKRLDEAKSERRRVPLRSERLGKDLSDGGCGVESGISPRYYDHGG